MPESEEEESDGVSGGIGSLAEDGPIGEGAGVPAAPAFNEGSEVAGFIWASYEAVLTLRSVSGLDAPPRDDIGCP